MNALDRIPRPVLLAGLFFCLSVPALLAVRIWMTYETPRDFSYFWMTGRIWMNGDNPYGPDYAALAAGVWRDQGFHRWLYSPHIWPVTRMLAAFDYDTARGLWVAINALLIYVGTAFAVAAAPLSRRARPYVFAGLAAYTAAALGATLTLATGQFGAFAYLGVAAFAYAAVRRKRWAMGLALFVLTMKASLGLAFVAFALMDRRWWGTVLVTGAAALLASVPVLIATPLPEIVSGYLHGVGAYGGYSANAAASMTGLRTLAERWAGTEISGLALALLAAAAGAAFGWHARLAGVGTARLRANVVAVLAVVLFLVPLHLYDLALVSVLVIGLGHPLFAAVLLLSLLVLFRVNRLSGALAIPEPGSGFPGSYVTSLVLALLAAAALAVWARREGSRR